MKILPVILLALVATQVPAAVVCKGGNYNITSTYTFTKATNTKNLQLTINDTLLGNKQYQIKGTAIYTSTNVLELLSEKSILESYYYFNHGNDSYTEMISLSSDLRRMGSSRPDPNTEHGNYIKLTCTGKL